MVQKGLDKGQRKAADWRLMRNEPKPKATIAAGWTRNAALLMPCPRCGAGPGRLCKGKRRARVSVHRERLYAARDAVIERGKP